MNRVDPKLLQVFADVVDQGSFTGAADIRETNVSYVTRQIKRLESDLGIRLLNRSTRALALTATGKRVYEHAQQLNELVRNVAAITEEKTDSLSGTLRITSAVYIGRKFVFPAVEALCDRYPNLTVDLQLSDAHVDIIKERFDLAFRIWKPKDVDLIGQNLLDVQFIIAAAPSFIEKYGTPDSIEALQSLPAIAYSRKGHTNKSFNYLDEAGKCRSFSLNANLVINDAEQLSQSVARGERYFVPTNFMAAEAIRQGQLIQLLPNLKISVQESVYAVYPNRALPKAARMLIQEVKQSLSACHMSV